MKLTINQLIEKLEELKTTDGYSGDTPVFLETSHYWASDLFEVRKVNISKKDFENNKGRYSVVSNRGVKAVIIC